MAIVRVVANRTEISDFLEAKRFLAERSILLERWQTEETLRDDASQEEVLNAYRAWLGPYMQSHGYQSADVVVLHADMPGRDEIRAKFLREHTHSEDEVRYFVDGSGLFFHQLNETSGEDEVFSVLCQRGDLISVPAGIKHWFDCGERPFVKAIRIFQDRAGWVPHYTGSGIETKYADGGSA